MPDTICDIVARRRNEKYATMTGTRIHEMLRHIVIDGDTQTGDRGLIESITACPGLSIYFAKNAKTEVPIAGTIGNVFASRRIDRMIVDDKTRTIKILDYKTDTDKTARRQHYVSQLREYCDLLRAAYPGYRVDATILWTHDWTLETL